MVRRPPLTDCTDGDVIRVRVSFGNFTIEARCRDATYAGETIVNDRISTRWRHRACANARSAGLSTISSPLLNAATCLVFSLIQPRTFRRTRGDVAPPPPTIVFVSPPSDAQFADTAIVTRRSAVCCRRRRQRYRQLLLQPQRRPSLQHPEGLRPPGGHGDTSRTRWSTICQCRRGAPDRRR